MLKFLNKRNVDRYCYFFQLNPIFAEMLLALKSGCELPAGLREPEFSSYLEGPPVAKLIPAITKGTKARTATKTERRVVPRLCGKSCRV